MSKLKLSKLKNNSHLKFEMTRMTLAIVISLLLAFVIIFLVSSEPIDALRYLFLGPLESSRRFMNVVEMMIPLTFTGLAVTIMFKAKQFNMIAEGVFYVGGVIASIVAIKLPLPIGVHPLVAMLLAGFIGGVIATIPSLIQLKWKASELVTSLMMNFILFNLGLFVINNYFRDANAGAMASYEFLSSANLGNVLPKTRLHYGLFVVIVMWLFTCFFLNRTKEGYKLRITGENSLFAKYSGLKTSAIIIFSQFLGGFIASVGGATEMLGMYDRFKWQDLTNYGFDGIIVAILAKENPKYIPVAAFFLAYLRIGADKMGSSSDVTFEMVSIIQGIIIMLIAAKSFMNKYHQKMIEKEANING